MAEVTHHLNTGQIEHKDAHRAMNEAFGRLLYSRRKRAEDIPAPAQPQAQPNEPEITQHGPPWGPPGNPTMRPPGTQRGGSTKQAWMGFRPSKKALKHKVAGWDWDDYQNGFITHAHQDFQCSCGEPVKVPDYHHCKCGKIWNTYVIGTGGGKKNAAAELYIAREIPVRDEVIVAKKKKDLRNSHYDDYSKWESDTNDQIENENPFPSNHTPKRDTRAKGVQNGKTSPDWHKRDHSSQQWR